MGLAVYGLLTVLYLDAAGLRWKESIRKEKVHFKDSEAGSVLCR